MPQRTMTVRSTTADSPRRMTCTIGNDPLHGLKARRRSKPPDLLLTYAPAPCCAPPFLGNVGPRRVFPDGPGLSSDMGEAVVYVHGLWMSGGESLLLRRRLSREFGLQVHAFRYAAAAA